MKYPTAFSVGTLNFVREESAETEQVLLPSEAVQ
jgi:hypothetical protein